MSSIDPFHKDGGFGIGEMEKPQIGKRVIHSLPRNPLDKSTIVSLFPKEIIEFKPTIFPGKFIIPAAERDSFSLLTVEGASWYMPSAVERMPPMEIQVNSVELAKSIVNDYLSSIYLGDSTRGPGLFYVLGKHDKKSILGYSDPVTKQTFGDMLEVSKAKQKRWFLALIDASDRDWSKYGGSPLAILEDAKIAAELLGMGDKPWMANIQASNLSPCPACGEMINLNYPVCKHCHNIVNAGKAKELGITAGAK